MNIARRVITGPPLLPARVLLYAHRPKGNDQCRRYSLDLLSTSKVFCEENERSWGGGGGGANRLGGGGGKKVEGWWW